MAAEEAQRFAEVAFVDRDFRKAYELLAESGKGLGSAELFKEFIVKNHHSAFPLFVKTTDYEPVPGKKRINIYVYGENGAEKFYYRVITVGVQETGYKVAGFDRADAPYPRSNLRHLKDLEQGKISRKSTQYNPRQAQVGHTALLTNCRTCMTP